MVINEIEVLRKKLNDLIMGHADFEEIQKVSHELDNCVLEYYNEKLKENI